MANRKRIKVKYSRLKAADGYSYGTGTVTVDARLRGRQQLEIIIHEAFHEIFPDLTEQQVQRSSATLTRTLWHEGYRRVDNDDRGKLLDE